MYSLVLMAALSTGGAEVGHWYPGKNLHGHGYTGGPAVVGGCYGGAGGYSGAGYSNGLIVGYNGCYGGPYYGNFSSWYGCHGCYGCYGCYGCAGYVPLQGAGPGVGGETVPPPAMRPAEPIPAPAPEAKPAAKPAAEPVPPPTKTGGGQARAVGGKATLVVHLPADAKFYVDDQYFLTKDGYREFNTPVLQAGQAYYYILRAEVLVNGRPIRETKKVLVRAGDLLEESFAELTAAVKLAREQATARR